MTFCTLGLLASSSGVLHTETRLMASKKNILSSLVHTTDHGVPAIGMLAMGRGPFGSSLGGGCGCGWGSVSIVTWVVGPWVGAEVEEVVMATGGEGCSWEASMAAGTAGSFTCMGQYTVIHVHVHVRILVAIVTTICSMVTAM